jgi:hypothetical protein
MDPTPKQSPPEADLIGMTPSDPESPDPEKLRDESRESIEKVRRMIVTEGESSTGEEPPPLVAARFRAAGFGMKALLRRM